QSLIVMLMLLHEQPIVLLATCTFVFMFFFALYFDCTELFLILYCLFRRAILIDVTEHAR
ncbi:hypothetical protein ACJX0J_011418, partial [Zea mays]